jgi:hypothetical protein
MFYDTNYMMEFPFSQLISPCRNIRYIKAISIFKFIIIHRLHDLATIVADIDNSTGGGTCSMV